MKNKWTIGFIIFGLILFIMVLILSKPEESFKTIELSNKNFVLNQGSKPYLDTIIQVGLDKMGIEGHTMLIKEQESKRDLGDEFSSEAFILYRNNQSIIFIKPSLTRTKAIKILSHELVHLQQYLDERLIVFDNGYVCWENDTLDFKQILYDKRPWEIEAFNYSPIIEEDIKLALYEQK
jgi:hypothetical protein